MLAGGFGGWGQGWLGFPNTGLRNRGSHLQAPGSALKPAPVRECPHLAGKDFSTGSRQRCCYGVVLWAPRSSDFFRVSPGLSSRAKASKPAGEEASGRQPLARRCWRLLLPKAKRRNGVFKRLRDESALAGIFFCLARPSQDEQRKVVVNSS